MILSSSNAGYARLQPMIPKEKQLICWLQDKERG
jgi:hypothetical protein